MQNQRQRWRRWLALLLAWGMLLQLPLTALAVEVGESEVLLDADADEVADDNENTAEIVAEDSDAVEPSEGGQPAVAEATGDDLIESISVLDDAEAAALHLQEEEDLQPEAGQEIHVTVSISMYGTFLKDKNGVPMAGQTVTLSGQNSYTMDDALKVAHEQYYPGGAETGYDYHADEEGTYDGRIYQLWGIREDTVPFIKSSLNHDCGNYKSGLSREVKDGDELHFYIQQQKGNDRLAFFTDPEQIIAEGDLLTLRLRQAEDDGKTFSDCEGADVYIDGVKQENSSTDDRGEIVITGLKSRSEPYFITVEKKTVASDGTALTSITAAYARIRVVEKSGQSGNYISQASIRAVTDEKEKEISLEVLDGTQAFIIPAEMAYLHYQKRAELYMNVKLDESVPEGCSAYAVYDDPRDGTVHRIKMKSGQFICLKDAIAKGVTYGNMVNYNQAIRSIRLDVVQSGSVVESKEIPIRYRNHLSKLMVTDSFGKERQTGFTDTVEDQQLIAEVPENAAYVEIATQPYGYTDTNKTITVDGETKTLSYYQGYRLALDWSNRDEYEISIGITENGKVYCPETASYTLVLKKGEVDYTPKVELNTAGIHSVIVGSESPVLRVTATVLRPEEGTISYQWYQSNVTQGIESEYALIDGAVEATYAVPTEKRSNEIGYRCQVTYRIDGKIYTQMSPAADYTIVAQNVELPEITAQPNNIICVAGKPVSEVLAIELKDTPWENLTLRYQWYQNKEENTETGTPIAGATKNFYTPSAPGEGTVYYYCKVQYRRWEWNLTEGGGLSHTDSAEVCSDIASVSVIEEELPWEGSGSEKDPYKIKDLGDLEELREKVNKEGFSFSGMYFRMMTDIFLPKDWQPIGAIEPGKTTTGDGMYLWAFSGVFDGAGHTLTVADSGKPLFNYVRNAVVQNLNLYGKNINGYGLVDRYTVDYGVDGNYNTGCPEAITIRNVTLLSGMSTKKAGLIGGYASGANDVVIENCTAEKGVIIGYTKGESAIGTFAGALNGVIRNCHSAATVYGTNRVGGLAGNKGQSMGACTIENCSFTGTVTASGSWVGGILGSGYEADSAPNTPVASVKNCYVAGNVSGGSNVGGIFGGEPSCKQCWGNGSGAITNNFFYGTVSGSSNVGAIIGYLRGFDKFQGISNNYYLDACGTASGIGGIGTILTVSGNPQDLPYEYNDTYGIDYKFEQALYCFPKTAGEFSDGTVAVGLNSGNYRNWTQEDGALYPTYGAGAYATALEISGDYKKEYDLGEELDLSGATVTVTMSDGTKAHPEWKELTFIGYNPNKIGSQMLQVKYGAVETTITVAVFPPAGKIAVTFSLLGDSIHDSDTDGQVHTLSKGNLQTWIPETQMVVDSRATVKTVLEAALAANDMSCYNPKGNYVVSVTKGDVTLAEFTNGKNTGWMYTLNGHHPENAVNEQYLNNGDVVVFHYTDYYQIEEHEHRWLTTWSYDVSSHWKACEWNCGEKKEEAPHTFGTWRTISPATVDAAETQARSCVVCGYQETRSYGSPLEKTCLNDGVSHRYGAWTTTTAATVFSPETQVTTCELCGKKQYRQTGSALAPTMQVNVEKVTLKTGQSTTGFRVSGLAAGDSVASYTSSNTKIYTVNGSGKLTAKKKTGSAKLTVTLASGYSRTVTVTVQKPAVKTTKITGLAKKLTLEKGTKATLKPIITPFTSQQKVSYSSSNKKVATVSAKGVITAKKSGTAKITVKSGSKKFVVTVTVPKTPTTAITGVPSTVSVKKGRTYTLKAKVAPKSSEEKLTYTSSNKKVATVSKSGKIRGVKKGTATITIKSGKVSVKVTVTVK